MKITSPSFFALPSTYAMALLVALGAIWGSGYSIAKWAMGVGVSPLGYAFWQSLGPALLLGALSWKEQYGIVKAGRNFGFYLIAGLFGIAIPNSIMYFVAPHLPAGVLAIIVNTVPIMTYFIAFFMGAERFQWLRLLGIISGVLGMLIILLPHAVFPNTHVIPWALLAFVTPVSFAFSANFIAVKRPANTSSLALSAGMLLASTFLILPLMLKTGEFYPLHWPLSEGAQLILLEIGLSSLGYVIFFKLIAIAGPVYYSLVSGIVTITGVLWGWLIFHESLTGYGFASMALIITGIAIVAWRQYIQLK